MSDRFLSVRGPGRAGMGIVLALCAALLAGCATPTVTARVTSFQRWPQGAEGQRYAFAAVPEVQAKNLEYQSYQDTMRAGLGRTGLVEAAAGQPARFTVSFSYGTAPKLGIGEPPGRSFLRAGLLRPGLAARLGMGRRLLGPGLGGRAHDRFRNTLNLEIHDASQGGRRVTARPPIRSAAARTWSPPCPAIVRAIFDGFPAIMARSARVEYPAAE